ncbi:hypothetical protein T492DRAFT_835425 [Pavlovales sp. CCMP2436]|nr:hypothetical protein T492DRAFT_835425 [Pavlovales sp. CCMP2436]
MEKKNEVSKEPATVTVAHPNASQPVVPESNQPAQVTSSASSVASSSAPPAAPVKAKRVPSEKQKLNYLAANARRIHILADAKIIRVAEASEKAREKAALEEYALAIKLASKYGFVPDSNQSPQTPQTPQSPHQQPTQPEANPTQPPLRYYERPPIKVRYV